MYVCIVYIYISFSRVYVSLYIHMPTDYNAHILYKVVYMSVCM